MPPPVDAEARRREEARVRAAYARRARDVPQDRYALYRPEWIHVRSMQLEALAGALLEEDLVPFGSRSILEVGCGSGQWLVEFESMGAQRARLAGLDLDASRLETAGARLSERRDPTGRIISEGADLRAGNAADLPWRDGSFDIVFQSTLFTSVLDRQTKRDIAAEMVRVLRPDGVILWYDFLYDNPRNSDVKGIRRREIERLFPDFDASLRRVTLAPPLSRMLAPRSRILATALERLRFLNTHYLGVLRRRSVR